MWIFLHPLQTRHLSPSLFVLFFCPSNVSRLVDRQIYISVPAKVLMFGFFLLKTAPERFADGYLLATGHAPHALCPDSITLSDFPSDVINPLPPP